MARAGRGQPTNVLFNNNITNQTLGLTVQGDITATLEGVDCYATQASLTTGIFNQPFDGVICEAVGATNHGELAVTLDNVRSTARGANLNVVITPNPPTVGKGTHGMHPAQHRHGIELLSTIGQPTPPPTSTTTAESFLLLSSGDFLLQPDGDRILLEINNG